MVRLANAVAALASVAAPGGRAAGDGSVPYNVLFVAVDDLRPTLGAYGDPIAHTPHMDQLIGRGLRFENLHSNKPECAPSRISMLTGKRPDAIGMLGFSEQYREKNGDLNTIPQYLRNKYGYRSEVAGKLVDGRNFKDDVDKCSSASETACSFDEVVQPNDYLDNSLKLCNASAGMRWPGGQISDNDKFAHLLYEFDDKYTQEHVDFCISVDAQQRLRRLAQSSQPFFLGVGFAKPHMPWIAPKAFFDIYRKIPDHMLEPPPDLWDEDSKDEPMRDYFTDRSPFIPQDNGELENYSDYADYSVADRNRGYYASATFVDYQIGSLIHVLETEIDPAVRDRTMVILWGDHGFHLGGLNLWGKKSILEHATRVPAAVIPPRDWLASNPTALANINKGDLNTVAPADSVDFFPTIIELINGTLPKDVLAGTSLVPLLNDPASYVRTASVSQYENYGSNGMAYSIRTRNHRFIARFSGNSPFSGSKTPEYAELFRYSHPGNFELKNRIDDPAFAQAKAAFLDIINNIRDKDWTHLYTEKVPPFDLDDDGAQPAV